MADVGSVTEPLRRAINRQDQQEDSLATMSRRRFVTFQMVTVLTAIITCMTLLAVSLLKSNQMQERLLSWGETSTCVLNASTDLPYNDNNDGGSDRKDLSSVMDFLMRLSKECSVPFVKKNKKTPTRKENQTTTTIPWCVFCFFQFKCVFLFIHFKCVFFYSI